MFRAPAALPYPSHHSNTPLASTSSLPLEGILLGMGNPLLAISAIVDQDFLNKLPMSLHNMHMKGCELAHGQRHCMDVFNMCCPHTSTFHVFQGSFIGNTLSAHRTVALGRLSEGIWAGMLCGTALQTLILLVIVWKTNWKKEAAQASDRVRLWGG